MAIKNKLLEIRLQLGYKKQKDFAKYLNISPHQYNRYENNVVQPSLEIIYDLSLKLKIPIENIIYKVPN